MLACKTPIFNNPSCHLHGKTFTSDDPAAIEVFDPKYCFQQLSRLPFNHLSVFIPNTGKYGPEINPYLDIFHAV